MLTIQTDLTKLLDINFPIVAAPMAGASGGALAAQVSLAGGFGFIATGYGPSDDLNNQLAIARDMIKPAEGASLPIGVGFLVWLLERNTAQAEELLMNACYAQVQAIWLSFGENIGHWIGFIRSHDPNAGKKTAIKIFVQVSTALGASGVVIGTRFLLSPESLYTDSQREALLKADSFSTLRTMAFDHARNTLGWPEGVDGRGLRNDTVIDYENGLDMDTLRSRFAEGVKSGNNARMVVWAGSGVGLMNSIMSAKDITKELYEECLASLQKVGKLVQPK